MSTREENLKKINEQLDALSDDELEQVAGGTFTPNRYKEVTYNQAGIKTKYHFWDRDQFYATAATDKKEIQITEKQANWAVEYWNKTQKHASYETIVKNCKDLD